MTKIKTMKETVADLRAFVKALKKRPDIKVIRATLGRKATKKDLEKARELNEDLASFYAEMNGIHVEWEFIEPSGIGCIRIPAFSPSTKFMTDFCFGDNEEGILFDEITPEGASWLIRETGSADAKIVFRTDDEMVPAASIAEYLTLGMESGFGAYWPVCFTPHGSTNSAQEEAIKRFQAPPIKPAAIRVGVRVEFKYFSESGRGEVIAIRDVPEGRNTEFFAPKLVQLKADTGLVGWFPIRFMKAQTKKDTYELMRDPSFVFTPDISTFEDIARATAGYSRRGAGLLSARPFATAVELVADLYQNAKGQALLDGGKRPLEKSGKEFSAKDFKGGWVHDINFNLMRLFGGLCIYAAYESARRNVAGCELVDATLITKLEDTEFYGSEALVKLLRSDEVLALPSYHAGDPHTLKDLGLSAESKLFGGTGY